MPANPDKNVVYFARTDFRNQDRVFGIKRADRRQHTYIIGKTGTGKSTLQKNLVIQDVMNGEGLCLIDPHGEFVEDVLNRVPEERLDDIVYFNPADPDYSVGFNVLELPDPKYKHLVASGLMGIFTKIWSGVWSARMEYILSNAILALLDTPDQTLLGVTRILVDKGYRQMIVNNIKDPVVKAFWVSEYEEWKDQFRNEAIAPIQNKVGQFLSTSVVRNIVGQAKSTVSFDDIMNTGKILLVNVSKGRIGEENSALLGAMIITKLQLAAMERIRIPEEERADFFLYVDEFQNFATDSFASILSEARKYRLNLTIAHQYIGQLVTDTSTKVRDAIFGNTGTMIVFRVGAADAEFLENEFSPEFTIQDMVGIPNYHIYLKLMVDGITSRPFSAATLPPFKFNEATLPREKVIQNSRERYARPIHLVEEEITRYISGSATASLSSEPARRGLRPDDPRVIRTQTSLASMGIEFSSAPAARPDGGGRFNSARSYGFHAGKNNRSTDRRPESDRHRSGAVRSAVPGDRPVPGSVAEETIEKMAAAPPRPAISLSKLKSREQSPKPPKKKPGAPSIDDFRKSIKEATSKMEE